jgi:hypothetical protein
MRQLAGDATEAEPAVRSHPVVPDDQQIGAELGRGGDYRLGDRAFTMQGLRLDIEGAGSVSRGPENVIAAPRVVDIDEDQLCS